MFRASIGGILPTFMFTDIEGSTLKWQLHPDEMREALPRHDDIVRRAVEESSGRVVKHTGDGFLAVFIDGGALECALRVQSALQAADWSGVDGLRVRIGIHSGDAVESCGDFFGDAVNRAARLTSSAWGGQTVVGSAAAVTERLPEGAALEDAGLHMLKDLLEPERLLTLAHPSLASGFPPLRTVSSHPHNLPVQTTPFLGRESELAALTDLVSSPERRLVTILGHGGAGKTRTALQAAAELVTRFRDGVWFVPLESVSSPAGMVSAVAESLSLRFSGSRTGEEQLSSFLADRETLLVLDNFEHLTAHAPLVSRLLSSCPGLKAVATSRHRLGTREECVFDLSGMVLPHAPSDDLERVDSTSLFLAAARRLDPHFEPRAEEREAVSGICRLLDGLPLAIELAASWIRTIPCTELEVELERDLEMLESAAGDLPGRQRSMQAVFDYSWELLGADDRKALSGLSVFEGGFDREAASEVAGCGLKSIRNLMDRSLVRSRPGGGYNLHPLTRQFAADRLQSAGWEADDLEDRHCSFYGRFLEKLQPMTHSSRQAEAFDRIAHELPNLRKGMIHAHAACDFEAMVTYTRPVAVMLQVRSRFHEAVELFRDLLRVFEEVPSAGRDPRRMTKARAELLERTGTFLLMTGNHSEAGPSLEEACRLATGIDDPILQALCLAGLGNVAHVVGDLDGAEENWRKALALSRSSSISKSISSLLCNIASVRKRRGDPEGARTLLEEAAGLNRETGDAFLNAAILSNIADILALEGDAAGAEEKHRQSLAMRMELGDLRGVSFTLEKLSQLVQERSVAEALDLAREGLRFAEESGAGNRRVYALTQLARVLASAGDLEEAVKRLEEAEREAEKLAIPSLTSQCAEVRSFIDRLRV